jgi:hypothetical protein
VANERFARPDTSVTGQILKIIASNPMQCSSLALAHLQPCHKKL